jgi:hypothetical protein
MTHYRISEVQRKKILKQKNQNYPKVNNKLIDQLKDYKLLRLLS